jgi:tRNA (cytidine/uridine-2'-O-)-methyltransferase
MVSAGNKIQRIKTLMLSLALYHPQIPQNTGTLLRLGSCLGIRVHLIRPLGFLMDDKRLRRAGMDYLTTADYEIHDSFGAFVDENSGNRRIVALDVGESFLERDLAKVPVPHHEFRYGADDLLLTGSEHYGFLEEDLAKITHRVTIPMRPRRRSLNMAIAASMVLAEAMSQIGWPPESHR